MSDQKPLFDAGRSPIVKGAELSDDRVYRYALWRKWDGAASVAFIGLNPSTADESADDPTIRRCIGFARDWGYGGLVMFNLFAFRATDPRDLPATEHEELRVLNFARIKDRSSECSTIVAAWGAHAKARVRGVQLCKLLARPVVCLGLTKTGAPRHPLYVPKTATPVGYYRPNL